MKYLVIKHTYETKVTEVDKIFNSQHNAFIHLEETVFNYVAQYMGKYKNLHCQHHLNSRYWNYAPYGYLLMKHNKESLFKISILFKKKISSLFFDTYEMKSLYYYEIVRVEDKYIQQKPCEYCDEENLTDSDDEETEEYKVLKYNVLKELLQSTEKKEPVIQKKKNKQIKKR